MEGGLEWHDLQGLFLPRPVMLWKNKLQIKCLSSNHLHQGLQKQCPEILHISCDKCQCHLPCGKSAFIAPTPGWWWGCNSSVLPAWWGHLLLKHIYCCDSFALCNYLFISHQPPLTGELDAFFFYSSRLISLEDRYQVKRASWANQSAPETTPLVAQWNSPAVLPVWGDCLSLPPGLQQKDPGDICFAFVNWKVKIPLINDPTTGPHCVIIPYWWKRSNRH